MLWLNSLIFISSLPLGFLSGSSNRRDSRETRNQVKRERNILPVLVLLCLLMLPVTLKWQLIPVSSFWFSQNQLHFALPKIAVFSRAALPPCKSDLKCMCPPSSSWDASSMWADLRGLRPRAEEPLLWLPVILISARWYPVLGGLIPSSGVLFSELLS